jgi:tetratricopeptide (TPR) repeat protein
MKAGEREHFGNVLDLPSPTARAAYLERVGAEDPALRQRLAALLREHEQAGGFLEGGAPAPAPSAATPLAGEGPGSVIGRYKLLERIGEGGFGVVYMAEQREPVRRKVALKIIKLGMDTKQVIGRFEAERQALALMDHPNIARVLDGGATDRGRPYFVMELVRGLPLTGFCDERRLGTRERIELFITVCSAVQHAHQKGIIHRDLKPSNVLVTLYDDRPVPKVIDFGIAKALQGELTDKTVFTRFHEFLGTPAYMSPEQTQLNGLDADTRSDIYALGVLLYELLTGRPPFDSQELLTAGLDEMRRRIREDEPMRPSTRLRTLAGQDADTVARQRNTQPARLAGLLRGDLDWIVLKCLEKDRARRYESASALAQDLARHLADEPVTAAAPGLAYRLGKLVRRHRTGVLVGAGGLALLVVTAVVSSGFAFRTWRAERVAREEAAVAAAVSQFFNEDLFAVADGGTEPDPELTMRGLLDRAAVQLEGRFREQPRVEASVRAALGRTYFNLGQYAVAHGQWERAAALCREALGPAHRQTLLALSDVARARLALDQRAEARELAEQVLTSATAAFGRNDPLTVKFLSRLALVCYRLSDNPRARETSAEAVTLARVVPEVETEDLVHAMHVFGRMLGRSGERDRGEQQLREALALARRRLQDTHPLTVRAKNALAAFYYDHQIRIADAEQLYLEALAQQRRAFGEAHPLTLNLRYNLAILYAHREPVRPHLALAHRLRFLEHRPMLDAPAATARPIVDLLSHTPPEAIAPPKPLSADGWRMLAAVPPSDWTQRDFADGDWLTDRPGGTRELRFRRQFPWSSDRSLRPWVCVRGAGEFRVFLNGVAAQPVFTTRPVAHHWFLFPPEALATLRADENVLAIEARELDPENPVAIAIHRAPAAPEGSPRSG